MFPSSPGSSQAALFPGLVCAAGAALPPPDAAHHTPAALPGLGAEHEDHQPGQAGPARCHPGLAQVLPGELGSLRVLLSGNAVITAMPKHSAPTPGL